MKNFMRENKFIVPLVIVLVLFNLLLTGITYRSLVDFRNSMTESGSLGSLEKELDIVKKDVDNLKNNIAPGDVPQYPLKRYSIIYNSTMSFLFIVVLMNTGITIWVYSRMLRKIDPKNKIMADIRDDISTIKEMISVMPEMDEKGREALHADIRTLNEKINQSLDRLS